jgi:hypothetical protein
MKKILFIVACSVLILGCTTDSTKNETFYNSLEKDTEIVSLSSLIGLDINKTDFNIDLLKNKNENDKLKTKRIKLRNSVTIYNDPFRIIGEGNSTLIGKFDLFVELGFGPSDYFGPIATQTAANGDVLRAFLVSEGFDPELGVVLEWIFFEGTGRFENLVYGELTLNGTIQYVEGEEFDAIGELEGEGFITY